MFSAIATGLVRPSMFRNLDGGRWNVENLAGVIVVRTLGQSVAATATLFDIMDDHGIGRGDHFQLVALVPLLPALGSVGSGPQTFGLSKWFFWGRDTAIAAVLWIFVFGQARSEPYVLFCQALLPLL